MSNGSHIPVGLDAPPEATAAHPKPLGCRLRPVVALFGLILVAIAALFGVASSSLSEQSGVAMLFSCGPCHD